MHFIPLTILRSSWIFFAISLIFLSQTTTSLIAFILVVLGGLIWFIISSRKASKKKKILGDDDEDEDIKNFLKEVPRFPYEELALATNEFDSVLGQGGSSCVFMGKLRDGTCVAVKRISKGNAHWKRELEAELRAAKRVNNYSQSGSHCCRGPDMYESIGTIRCLDKSLCGSCCCGGSDIGSLVFMGTTKFSCCEGPDMPNRHLSTSTIRCHNKFLCGSCCCRGPDVGRLTLTNTTKCISDTLCGSYHCVGSNVGSPTLTDTMNCLEVRNINIVQLLGYCVVPRGPTILVYEFIKNGSLDRWIFPHKPRGCLPLKLRYKVALDVAKALSYLHNARILHLDVKPQNVLLDNNFQALLSDFGLSELMGEKEETIVVKRVRGTREYLAPEWILQSRVTPKTDVYSYGMLLLEMIGGQRNIRKHEDIEKWEYFPKIVFEKMKEGKLLETLDKRLMLDEMVDENEVKTLAYVALWCIQEEPKLRPNMDQVVHMLEGSLPVDEPPETDMFLLDLLLINSLKSSSLATSVRSSLI